MVDARLLRSERATADAVSVDVVRVDRMPRLLDLLDGLARPGDRLQPDRARLREQDDRGRRLSAVYGGAADPLVELLLSLGAEDGFIGCTIAPNIRFNRRIARSPLLRAAS